MEALSSAVSPQVASVAYFTSAQGAHPQHAESSAQEAALTATTSEQPLEIPGLFVKPPTQTTSVLTSNSDSSSETRAELQNRVEERTITGAAGIEAALSESILTQPTDGQSSSSGSLRVESPPPSSPEQNDSDSETVMPDTTMEEGRENVVPSHEWATRLQ